jgi:hypothetical protein
MVFRLLLDRSKGWKQYAVHDGMETISVPLFQVKLMGDAVEVFMRRDSRVHGVIEVQSETLVE